MTTQVNTKVRLVRCPKCLEVLAELPEVPLYKCGGCGTILEAKSRKMETNPPKEATSSNPPKEDSSLDKDNKHNSRMELCDDRSVSNGLSVSPEINCSESEDSPIEVETTSGHEESESPLGRNSKRNDSNIHDRDVEKTEERNFSDGLATSTKVEESTTEATEHMEQDEENQGEESQRALQKGESFLHKAPHLLELKDQEIVSHENGIALQSSEPSIKGDNDIDGLCTFTRPSTKEKSASQSALKASIISVDLVSPDNGHLDHSISKVTQHHRSASSVDTMGSSTLADPSSELRVKNEDIATRSYYAYDGSESSYDGTDDQITDHISHPSRRKCKDVDHRTTEMLKMDGYRVNNKMKVEPEMNYRAPSSSSFQYRATKGSQWNQDQFTGTESHNHIIGNRMRLDKGGVSRLPFDPRDFPVDHRTRSPSIYRQNLFPLRPGFDLPHKHLYSVPDKMDLLRTVCELKDQLDRIQFPKLAPNVRFPAGGVEEKHAPYYYDNLTPEKEMYADLNHTGYHVRYNQPKGARMAFSGEAAHYRHQMNCSCLHCCPQDRHFSAQLPSYSSSPQHYTSSELSWGCETNFENQRHRENEIKRSYLKEKYQSTKKHLRPIAGGAPVLACYHCSELLQLPADFLLFEKRYHQLLCNACKKVLKFSLLQRSHIVPYLSDAPAPPPSEVENYTDAVNRRNRVPVSHSNSVQNHEPVSCSDDYGLSSEMNTYNRKMSSGSSYEQLEDRKMKSILKESQTFESVGPSSKSSEIEELPPSTNSTLHRLMGYSSPSQVFKK